MNQRFSNQSVFGRGGQLSPSQQLVVSRFMSLTYGWMTLGLLVTALVSYAVASSPAMVNLIVGNQLVFFGLIISEVLLVIWLTAASSRLSAAAATLGFLAYAALNGATLSVILLVYTMSSIAQVFMITAGMFGGLAVYGTVTKRDLTAMGTFFGMGIWGLIIIGLVNMFIQSEALSLGMSVVGVVIFAGLTAYDVQKLRYMGTQFRDAKSAEKGAVYGALTLYLDFINLFLFLLRLFGRRR